MSTTTILQRALHKNPWPVAEIGGLNLIQSPLLKKIDSLVHCFTTRHGGSSPEPLQWFNLARHWDTEESRTDAMKNRDILCEALGLDAKRLTVPGQQHTNNIFVLEEGDCGRNPLFELDGVVTNAPNHPILLHFADCVPVMIYDWKKQVLCVLHAGWKGTASGIVSKGVKLLIEKYGTVPADIVAAVGPAIGTCCYPTGDEVIEKLSQTIGGIDGLVEWRDDKPHPDLKAINAMQLLEAGVQDVDVTDWCTACHPDIFYSHRQSGGKTGRQGALACIQ